MLSQDASLQAQVKQGIAAYEGHFGRKARGYWLPECSYRPRYHWKPPLMVPGQDPTPYLRKGVDEFLAENGIGFFFVEGAALSGGETLGVYADKFGPLRELLKQFQAETVQTEYRPFTPYQPYLVNSSGHDLPPLAVFGRDSATGRLVWSGEHGYPGDEWYLEFHKKYVDEAASSLGLRYWRISQDKADIGAKRPYEPVQAASRAQGHAAHFVPLVKEVLAAQPGDPILCAIYDTELYGHWWFEGPQWLYHVLKTMSADPDIELQTVSEYLDAHPASVPISLPEGSWGEGGFHYIWLNEETAWSWKLVYEVEREMIGPGPEVRHGGRRRAHSQAGGAGSPAAHGVRLAVCDCDGRREGLRGRAPPQPLRQFSGPRRIGAPRRRRRAAAFTRRLEERGRVRGPRLRVPGY